MKTNKSFTKRFKFTRKGKIVQRKPGMGHFNAKEKRIKQLERKKTRLFGIKKKVLGHFVPFK